MKKTIIIALALLSLSFAVTKLGSVGYGPALPSATDPNGYKVFYNTSDDILYTIYEGAWVASTLADAFVQGGNAFGTTATLGTTDNQRLSLITNNRSGFVLETSGIISNESTGSGTSIDQADIYYNKTSAGADDDQMNVKFSLDNTTSTKKAFVIQKIIAANATNGAEDGQYIVNVLKGGAATDVFKAGAQGITAVGNVILDKTITTAGTTGAVTINKTTGSVNFAAAATSLVVTNNLVSASSIILCTVATNDTTMKSVAVVAASGSFTIHANAAATAETRVNFVVLN